MADNVSKGIKDLQKNLEALDSQLLKSQQGAIELGKMIQEAMRVSNASVEDFLKQLRVKVGAQKENKIRLALEMTDVNGKPLTAKTLQDAINKIQNTVKSTTFGSKTKLNIFGSEFVGEDIKKRLADLKEMQKILNDTAKFYDELMRMVNKMNGDKSSNASKEWLERTALSTKEKKALDDATNGYIQQTQAIQDLNRTLDELRQKRAAAEALPVTGVGKKGVSYKTDLSKKSVLGKIDKEIEATEAKINNATTAAQKFQAQLIAMQGEKKTKTLSRALGVEEAEVDMQKLPTAFDRVIEQINQRNAQSKDKFAKQLINAEALKDEAKNAATQVSHELNYIWRGSQSHLLAAWRNNTGHISEYGRQAAVNQIRLSQEYKSNLDALKTQEIRDKLTQSLTRYKTALQAVVDLEEQQKRSAAIYAAQERAVEGVVRRFNETEQAIARVRDRWEELNVKKQAGLISEKDFKANTQKLLDEYDRLIAKRKEFETKDIGLSLSERLRKQQEEEKRLEAERVRSAKETSKILTEERGKQALSSLAGSPKMNAAVQQQLKYMQQIRSIGKDINALQANKNRNAEENALLEKRKKELRDVLELQKRLNNEQQGSANLARQIDAYNQLKGKVKETTDEVKRQKGSIDSILPTLRRLASAFGVAFSVQGLVQFGKKLVETRGEFEMQFVAMKQIIQDTDAATKIWNQTMQQALQSPFRAMQLVDYTKKLAAYRIETEKLFDTTKRLADVSAGLGVDMSRLILAYGQVKTANYLRASEVRQFTEAGVNIYGELAKYFSEIEGRAVGTAEVVERVSKRMVLFSDVEKIFQRMTDEGGTFFNMQEVQADTVRGQIMKLRDAYDQMLNTIGQANQGTIRNLVENLNDLVRNWQNVAFVLKANVNWITIIGTALYALSRNYLKGATKQTLWFSKAIMGNSEVLLKNTADIKIFSKVIGDYTLRTRIAVVATRTLQGALGTLGRVAKAIWPLLVFEGAVLLIERLFRARRELKRFREELESVTSENVGRMNEEISGYDALIKKLQKTNEGTAERKEILNEISNKYGKYLDFIVTEKTTVEELAGAYDNVVSSIRNYTAEKIREEQQQRLEKGIYDEYQDLVNSMTNKRVADAYGNQFKITKEQAKNIAKLIQQSLDKYGVVDIQNILETYFGKALGLTTGGGSNAGIGNLIKSYIKEYGSLKSELQEIRNDIEGQTPVFSSDAEYEDYKKRVQAANEELAEQAKRNEQINNLIKENNKEQWQADDALSKQRIANSEAELRIRRKYNLITQQEYESSLARLHGQLDNYETDYNNRLKKTLQSMSSFGPLWMTLDKDARDMYNYVVSTEDALQQGTEQRNKQLKESYQGLKESLKQYQSALAAGGDKDSLNKNITWTQLMIKALELAAKLRGIDLTDKKTQNGRSYDSISSLISLLKEMNSEYDKLSKSAYGFAKSNEKVIESFAPAFKEIVGFAGIDISQVDTTSKKSTADAMKLVIDKLDANKQWGKFGRDGGKKARQEFIKAWGEMAVEADIELTTRTREDIAKQLEYAFGDYQLTLDLEKLQLPSGLLKDMFDIDGIDLAGMRQKLEELSAKLVDENGIMTGDNLKLYEQWLKKLDDEERKLQQQRLKDYSKYLEHQLSDRAKLEMEYVHKVAEVQSEIAYDDTTRQRVLDGLRKEYEKNIAKQDWEDFKGSEMYIEMMEDLAKQGTAALEEMRKKLLEVRDNAENLSPRALKEVINALEKIDETIYGRMSPFQAVSELRKQTKGAMNQYGIFDISEAFERDRAAKEEYEERRKRHEQIEQEIADKQKLKNISEQLGDVQYEDIEMLRKRQMSAQQNLKDEEEHLKLLGIRTKENEVEYDSTLRNINIYSGLSDQYQKQIDLLTQYQSISDKLANSKYKDKSLRDLLSMSKEEQEAMGITEDEMKNMVEILKYWKLLKDFELKALDEAKNYLSTVQGIVKNTSEMLTTFGVQQNPLREYWSNAADAAFSYAQETIDAIKQFKESANAATAAGKALATGNYIQLALQLLGVLIQIINQIGLFRGAKINKEIAEQQERLDALSLAYERLEKSIAKTLTTSSYLADYNRQIQNTYEQISATEAQLAAARSRKNVDPSEINGYVSTLNGLNDQLSDLRSQMREVFGGIGGNDNYRSWAEEFVAEWRSAFLETGDGLDALKSHFEDFLQSWFEKQATMRIAGRLMEPLMTMIDSSVDDGVLTRKELADIQSRAAELFPMLNEQLREFYQTLGFGEGQGSLSGLSQAISGMTEEQANILEAYWNSVRMHTASIDLNVAAIANALGVGGSNPETNPMLQQMRITARNVANINSLLESVVATGHSKGRSGIKVFMN